MSIRAYRLSDMVPRPVPALVRIRLLVGPGWAQLVWFAFGFGMLGFWLSHADENIIELLRGGFRRETAQGVVTGIRDTGITTGDGKVSATDYRFTTPEGAACSGGSYSTGIQVQPNQPVTVEYSKSNPGNSCIRGMRPTPVGHLILIVLLFPAIPAPFIVWVVLTGRKGIRLLRSGTAAMGTLKSIEDTCMSSGGGRHRAGRIVMKLTLEFTASDGAAHTAVMRTSRPERLVGQEAVNRHRRKTLEKALDKARVPKFLEGLAETVADTLKDEYPVSAAAASDAPIQAPLLYDPTNPDYAVMLDALPGNPHIDEEGRIGVKGPFVAILGLIIPLLVIGANVAAAVHRYGR